MINWAEWWDNHALLKDILRVSPNSAGLLLDIFLVGHIADNMKQGSHAKIGQIEKEDIFISCVYWDLYKKSWERESVLSQSLTIRKDTNDTSENFNTEKHSLHRCERLNFTSAEWTHSFARTDSKGGRNRNLWRNGEYSDNVYSFLFAVAFDYY